MVVSWNVGSGNRTWVLYKSRQSFQPLRILSIPQTQALVPGSLSTCSSRWQWPLGEILQRLALPFLLTPSSSLIPFTTWRNYRYWMYKRWNVNMASNVFLANLVRQNCFWIISGIEVTCLASDVQWSQWKKKYDVPSNWRKKEKFIKADTGLWVEKSILI